MLGHIGRYSLGCTFSDKNLELFKKKWTYKNKLDINRLVEEFYPLSLEQQEGILKSLPYAMKEFNTREDKYIPEAHNYIKLDKFIPFYDKAMKKEREDKRSENEWKKTLAMRTPEQWEKIRRENEK